MENNSTFFKIAFLYFYMYFVGPLIWGVWMIYKLRIITFQEFSHCILSPVTIIMFFSYFFFNFFFMKSFLNRISNSRSDNDKAGKASYTTALLVHCVSLLSFGIIGTSIFMLLLSTNNFSFIKINLGDWLLKALIGSLSGASLVFLFYILFSVIIFTSVVDTTQNVQRYAIRKTLLNLRTFNLAVYIFGLVLFIGTAVASFLLNNRSLGNSLITRELVINCASVAFPTFMSMLLFIKANKKIDSFIEPQTDNSTPKEANFKNTMIYKIKLTVQLGFLLVFFILLLSGKIRGWLFFLIMGFCASLLAGRVYCGWLCPVNTMNGFIDMLYKLLSIRKRSIPKFLQHRLFRITFFTLFLGLLIFSALNGSRIQIFTTITFSGVIISGIFVSSYWCDYLCPWGMLLKFTSKFSLYKWFVDQKKCTNCRICTSACPFNAIQISNNNIPRIEFNHCLHCGQCTKKCPKNAIKMKCLRSSL